MPGLRELYDAFHGEIDLDWMLSETEALWRIEFGQTWRDHRRAARYAERLMQKSGLERVERIPFPADGETTFQDKTMPIAWDAGVGRLEVVRSPVPIEPAVVADYERHPFHLVRGSVSTPKGGQLAPLISEGQMYTGCDARGAMVLLAPETRPSGQTLRAICDLGALGYVSQNVNGRYLTPDDISWVNGSSEGPSWHVHAGDRPFIGFSVSPRMGDALYAAVRAGDVTVRVESDGRRHADEIDLVTAVLPGRDSREVWLLSHMYEPLANDNNTGCIATIEVARAIKRMIDSGRLPRPRFTLRLVLGMEMYGFAAYAHQRGGRLKNKVLGALNMDGFAVTPRIGAIQCAPAGTPFFGDYIMEDLLGVCKQDSDLSIKSMKLHGSYSDDMFLSDSTTGVPTLWAHGSSGLWHNSAQTMEWVHGEPFRAAAAFHAAWVSRVLTLERDSLKEQLRAAESIAKEHLSNEADSVLKKRVSVSEARKLMAYRCQWEEGRMASLARLGGGAQAKKSVASVRNAGRRVTSDLVKRLAEKKPMKPRLDPERRRWLDIAAAIVPRRATVGFPHDLNRVPQAERRSLPGGVIYGSFSRVMSNMDGRKTLKELLLETEWEADEDLSPRDLRKYLGAVEYLTEYGYLKTRFLKSVAQRDIVAAVKRAGVKAGDLVMLHSGMALLGHVEGGPDAIIGAMMEVLGDTGTLLMPTFSFSEMSIGGRAMRNKGFRPYHPGKSRPWVGRVPTQFLEWKGVMRSAHPSHSVAGIGPLAEVCMRDHREYDAPVCMRSPFGKLLDHDGKIVWLGTDLTCSTLLHLMEDELRMPYLEDALCRVERADGSLETVHVPRHMWGHRDFYHSPSGERKIFKRLRKDGLRLRRAPLGFGEVKLVRAKRMYELGIAALQQTPDLLLCEREDCLFCRKYSAQLSS